MRASVIEFRIGLDPASPAGQASVRLDPGLLARIFGAWPEIIELVADERWHSGEVRWRSVTTRRDLREMRHSALILEALERVPLSCPDTDGEIAARSTGAEQSANARTGQRLPRAVAYAARSRARRAREQRQ